MNWLRLKEKVALNGTATSKLKKKSKSMDSQVQSRASSPSSTSNIATKRNSTLSTSLNYEDHYANSSTTNCNYPAENSILTEKVLPSVLLGERVNSKTKSNYVALDCEMVGIGINGKQSALARCCVVDFDGRVLYDKFVRPPSFVTDFRTKWSGVRKQDLRQGTAATLLECQTAVAKLIAGKVLVGHALSNDLSVLMLSHSRNMIRDTATYRPLMKAHGKTGKLRPRSLKNLTQECFGISIQTGEHDPSEDARCAMWLYRAHRADWEATLKERKKAAMIRSSQGQNRSPGQNILQLNSSSAIPELSSDSNLEYTASSIDVVQDDYADDSKNVASNTGLQHQVTGSLVKKRSRGGEAEAVEVSTENCDDRAEAPSLPATVKTTHKQASIDSSNSTSGVIQGRAKRFNRGSMFSSCSLDQSTGKPLRSIQTVKSSPTKRALAKKIRKKE